MAKKYYPKIKFIVDKKEDKEIIVERERDLKVFLPPGMSFVRQKKFAKDKKKILSAFVDEFYLERERFLLQNAKHTEMKWNKVQKKFFNKVDKLFQGWPWPEGDYRGFISIARSHPRNIKLKFFFFPSRNYRPGMENIDIKVIAHEMLHFIEYDYLKKKFGLVPSEFDSKDNAFWQFTENLNVLIENSDFWKEFNLGIKWKPYGDCIDMYKKMKKVWDKKQDVDALVEVVFGVKPLKKYQ